MASYGINGSISCETISSKEATYFLKVFTPESPKPNVKLSLSVTGATIMNSQINPLRLRQFWTIVESSQASTLVRLDDVSLAESLLRQLRSYQILDAHESQLVSEYIQAKLPLIRDLASQRMPALNY
jgi:hypothetical protein